MWITEIVDYGNVLYCMGNVINKDHVIYIQGVLKEPVSSKTSRNIS